MLGYDYDIIYKKGKDNIVEDALSRQHEEDGSLALPYPYPFLIGLRTSNRSG
jgi:hypothetical protein